MEQLLPEILIGNSQWVKDLSVNGIVLQIERVHLLSDLLQRGLRAQRCQIGANITMRLIGDLLQLTVISQLHILGVDAQDLESAYGVRNTNVNL